jgi:hypothetical protein
MTPDGGAQPGLDRSAPVVDRPIRRAEPGAVFAPPSGPAVALATPRPSSPTRSSERTRPAVVPTRRPDDADPPDPSSGAGPGHSAISSLWIGTDWIAGLGVEGPPPARGAQAEPVVPIGRLERALELGLPASGSSSRPSTEAADRSTSETSDDAPGSNDQRAFEGVAAALPRSRHAIEAGSHGADAAPAGANSEHADTGHRADEPFITSADPGGRRGRHPLAGLAGLHEPDAGRSVFDDRSAPEVHGPDRGTPSSSPAAAQPPAAPASVRR